MSLLDNNNKGVSVSYGDNSNLDSFHRLRVSEPKHLIATQLTYDLQPLLYDQVTAESGASIAHDSTDRCALMTFSSTPTGGKAYMQSFEYARYEPGRSHLAFVTFNFIETVANVLKFAGYSDGSNGFEFRANGTTLQFALLSDTGTGDQIIDQSNWNLDKLDGTGDSAITLDVTKTQILVIDIQALYTGRVRMGFDIDGRIFYAHEFLHANSAANPYIQTANLPVRCGMTCTGTVSTTMKFTCASVITEGGLEAEDAFEFAVEKSVTAGNGARTHLMSIRPKTTFNSIENRSKFVLLSFDLLVTGNSPVLWELCIGQALTTPSYAAVNAAYSAYEVDTAGTLSGSPAAVFASGYVVSSGSSKGTISQDINLRYPITLDEAGAVRDLGTLTVLVTGLGGDSACRGVVTFGEER